MYSDGSLFLGIVVAAFAVFTITVGYQSFAEWRHDRRHASANLGKT